MSAGHRAGFTLIEIMVSVVILAVGLVLVIESLQGVFMAVKAARDTTRTALQAQEMFDLEALRLRVGRVSSEPPPEPVGLTPRIRDITAAEERGRLYRIDLMLDENPYLASYLWMPLEDDDD